MKRNLIAFALAGLSVVANAAVASEWSFDDAYWKRAETVQRVDAQPQVRADAAAGKYDAVDRFNP